MSKKLSEKIKDLIMTHITNPTSVGYGKTWDWFEKHSHFGEFYRGAVELEQRIAELEEAQRWNPVSERLPEENGQYLIFWECKHGKGIEIDAYSTSLGWHDVYSDLHTHWMPLPEPPIVYGKVCEE